MTFIPKKRKKTHPVVPDITLEEVRELFDYDPLTGVFRWKTPPTKRVSPGDIAGTAHNAGYWALSIRGKPVLAHRVAWFYVHGEWPSGDIDHINRDTIDNRLENLRVVSRSENNMNRKRSASSGFKGVCLHKASGLWTANTKVKGVPVHLGYYKTAEEAGRAYDKFVEDTYGDVALTNEKLGGFS